MYQPKKDIERLKEELNFTVNGIHPTIKIGIYDEEIPVRGNYIVSGDDELDKKEEDQLIEELNNGDFFKWCFLEVTARVGAIEGSNYLGCVTLDEKEFNDLELDNLYSGQGVQSIKYTMHNINEISINEIFYSDLAIAAIEDLKRELESYGIKLEEGKLK